MSTSNASRDLRMHDFRSARGQAADEDWAATAWASLVLRGAVSSEAADEELQRVLALVRESGEGPEELYGPPQEWARDRTAEWASEGSPAFRDDATSLRDVPQVAAMVAAVLSLLLGLVSALQGEWTTDWTIAWLLIPFLGSVLGLGIMSLWDRMAARHSMAASAGACGGLLILGAALLATLFGLTNDHPVARASTAWCVPLALAYGVLAWVLGRLVPEAPAPHPELDDEAWTGSLARMLRSRPDLTEPRVQELLDEVRSHASASGRSLQEEFGNPAAYVAQVSPRPIVRARRSALYRVGLFAIYLWLDWDGLLGHASLATHIFYGVGMGCLALLAVSSVLRYLRLDRSNAAHR